MTVTNEQIQQYREIVENAPDGATHVDDTYSFWQSLGAAGFHAYHVSKFVAGFVPLHPKSLANLRTIVKQHDEIQRLRGMISEQTKED